MACRVKNITRKVGFAAFTVLLDFAVLEAGYRLFLGVAREPGQEALFEPDPVLGRRHVKNARALVVEWSTPTPNRVTINALGFRGPNPRTVEKPPGVIRVILQGGSTTEDIFVE